MTAWAIDLDGVVWRGGETVPGAPEAIGRLRATGHQLAFVTNSALRTPTQVGDKLARHGVPDAADLVITSATAAASLIEPGERVVVVGAEGLTAAVADRGAEVVPTGPADCVLVGLSPTFHYDDITRAMHAIEGGARFIASNADATFPDAGRFLPGAGSIVAAIATATGAEPVIAGKPHETIVGFVHERLGTDGIMVGDRPETDGLFARALGYRFGLVLTGVVGPDDLPIEPDPDHVADDLASLVLALDG